MKKLAYIAIKGMTKKELKESLSESDLVKKSFLRSRFKGENISVDYKMKYLYPKGRSLIVNIYSDDIEKAANICNSISKKREELSAGINKKGFHIDEYLVDSLREYMEKSK